MKKILTIWAVMIGLGILYVIYLQTHELENVKKSQLAEILNPKTSTPEPQLKLDEKTKSYNCLIEGSLPDHSCTPGAIFSNTDQSQVCVEGYSKTVRKVSISTRKKVFAEYNISYPVTYGSYEVDHLIPLSLGGSNDIANLWPEAAEPPPGFKQKDIIEYYLHEQTCAGKISLQKAQFQIANDWLLIYDNLDQKIIEDFKNRFHSWAD